jgi:hypothetical protein
VKCITAYFTANTLIFKVLDLSQHAPFLRDSLKADSYEPSPSIESFWHYVPCLFLRKMHPKFLGLDLITLSMAILNSTRYVNFEQERNYFIKGRNICLGYISVLKDLSIIYFKNSSIGVQMAEMFNIKAWVLTWIESHEFPKDRLKL